MGPVTKMLQCTLCPAIVFRVVQYRHSPHLRFPRSPRVAPSSTGPLEFYPRDQAREFGGIYLPGEWTFPFLPHMACLYGRPGHQDALSSHVCLEILSCSLLGHWATEATAQSILASWSTRKMSHIRAKQKAVIWLGAAFLVHSGRELGSRCFISVSLDSLCLLPKGNRTAPTLTEEERSWIVPQSQSFLNLRWPQDGSQHF